jgi:ATP-dependent Clp protease protease subunit
MRGFSRKYIINFLLEDLRIMASIPYVIEGEGQKERVYDLYSRLLKDRIIFIGTEFEPNMANAVTAQLLFLEADDPDKDITMYINSPGGLVSSCLAIYDVMNYIKPDVSTVCIGEAASAAAFILAAGAKGKRFALHNARIMMHQVSGGAAGHIEDMKRAYRETEVLNDLMSQELAQMTGKSLKQLKKDLDRDYYVSAEEAKKYGVIDKVLVNRG